VFSCHLIRDGGEPDLMVINEGVRICRWLLNAGRCMMHVDFRSLFGSLGCFVLCIHMCMCECNIAEITGKPEHSFALPPGAFLTLLRPLFAALPKGKEEVGSLPKQ